MPATEAPSESFPVPALDRIDVVFGNAKHLPPYDSIPDEFKRMRGNKYTDFVSRWFFDGLKEGDLARLTAKPGIDRTQAMAAISAALRSFEPKHEHKEAGCGYLLSQWFDLAEKPAA
jgi:hypothetical protein